jgi:hypothetical protein
VPSRGSTTTSIASAEALQLSDIHVGTPNVATATASSLCDDRSIDILTPRHKSADTQAGIHATPANLDSGPYADGVTQSTSTGLRPQYGYIDHTDYYYKSYKKKRGIDGTLLVLFTHYTNWKVFAPVISWPTISLLLTYFCPPS